MYIHHIHIRGADLQVIGIPVIIDAAGQGQLSFPLNVSSAFIGRHFYTQFGIVDPFVSSFTKVVVSNGLDSTIGGAP